MADVDVGPDRLGHGRRRFGDRGRSGRAHVHADPAVGDEGIEGAAKGDVDVDRPNAGHGHRHVEAEHERRHAFEPHRAAAVAVDGDVGDHEAAGALDRDPGLRGDTRDEVAIHGKAAERQDGVAAHGAVALVVQEQDGQVGVRAARRHQDGAVHAFMAARLEHQEAA